ncbi:hypothetical protein BC830DRAFT_116996 [Chytriomyces sp. MP71]|nr:hypothetical protein BC830DRAFT_116996 [Chytriomyces sp. MP71]
MTILSLFNKMKSLHSSSFHVGANCNFLDAKMNPIPTLNLRTARSDRTIEIDARILYATAATVFLLVCVLAIAICLLCVRLRRAQCPVKENMIRSKTTTLPKAREGSDLGMHAPTAARDHVFQMDGRQTWTRGGGGDTLHTSSVLIPEDHFAETGEVTTMERSRVSSRPMRKISADSDGTLHRPSMPAHMQPLSKLSSVNGMRRVSVNNQIEGDMAPKRPLQR